MCCAHRRKPFIKASMPYVPGWTHTIWRYGPSFMNDMCVALVKELEESTDEEVEMREEKVHYDVKRGMAT